MEHLLERFIRYVRWKVRWQVCCSCSMTMAYIVVAYIAMACIAMAYMPTAYVVAAYIVTAYIVMAAAVASIKCDGASDAMERWEVFDGPSVECSLMGHLMAFIVMAYIAMEFIAMAYMACIIMDCSLGHSTGRSKDSAICNIRRIA